MTHKKKNKKKLSRKMFHGPMRLCCSECRHYYRTMDGVACAHTGLKVKCFTERYIVRKEMDLLKEKWTKCPLRMLANRMEKGDRVLVSEPRHTDSTHKHSFEGTYIGMHGDHFQIEDQGGDVFCVEQDEIEEVNGQEAWEF